LFGKISEIKTPDPHLIDPMTALRRMKIAKYTLPLLVKKEKKLRRRSSAESNCRKFGKFRYRSLLNI
jgi:hypothetical protein